MTNKLFANLRLLRPDINLEVASGPLVREDSDVDDSGGLEEKTTVLGVPCLTLQENTEHPIMVEQGTNTMVGRNIEAIRRESTEILAGRGKQGRVPELWDGRTAERIANDLAAWLIQMHQAQAAA